MFRLSPTHRRDGVWLAIGGDADSRRERAASIEGVAAVVLRALGVDERRDAGTRAAVPYNDAEEAQVAARLRALGYLE